MSFKAVLILGLCLLNGATVSAISHQEFKASVSFPKGQSVYLVAAGVDKDDLAQRTIGQLSDYLQKVLGHAPIQVASLHKVPKGISAIMLCANSKMPDGIAPLASTSPEAFMLKTLEMKGHSLVLAAANSSKGMKQAIHRMVIKSRQEPDKLSFPAMDLAEAPWIPQREWTNCLWTPQFVRGIYMNPAADVRMDILRFSDEQLDTYVDMFDWFGFNGGQLIQGCYSYGALGSPEAYLSRQRQMAQRLKYNGQEVTLWVWAAQFTGFGWQDPSVAYPDPNGPPAWENPRVDAAFEKYYDLYAQLAPLSDRVIAHFIDPGVLTRDEDIFHYLRLLEKKCREKNPNIRMGIDTWGRGPDYLKKFTDNGFKDYLLLANSMPVFYQPGDRERLHELGRALGLELGIWGWYMTEYESDQLASLYITARLYKNFCQELKNGVLETHPVTYWSEMEAHHLNNIYSLYAAGQLLWNPERDPDELLWEISEAIWGEANGAKVYEALELIQEMRSGDKWDAYWWGMPEYQLGSGDPYKDHARAMAVLQQLESMQTNPAYVPKIPLPCTPQTLVELMIPHLKQIMLFADFRCKVTEIKKTAKAGASSETLQAKLVEAWQPIPEYDTWIGNFGQIEQRLQRKMVYALAEKMKVTVKDPEPLRAIEADRLLQYIRNIQKTYTSPAIFKATDYNFGLMPDEQLHDRYQKLLENGLIVVNDKDTFRLADWEAYADPRGKVVDKTARATEGIMDLGAQPKEKKE